MPNIRREDPTHGDAQRNLENMRKVQAAPPPLSKRERLKQQLAAMPCFMTSSAACIEVLMQDCLEVHLQAGEVVFEIGEPCHAGQTPFYVLLEGKLSVENALGLTMGFVNVGEVFGEGGAISFAEERSETVRVCEEPAIALRINEGACAAAFAEFPAERDTLEDSYFNRQSSYKNFEEAHSKWIQAVVIPALAGTALLAGCPNDLLYDVGAPLVEKSYKDGSVIAMCGEPADSMLLLLEGAAEVEAKSGARIGQYTQGATFGEVSALGLFSCRTVTVRSVGRSRVLEVTSKALRRAIERTSEVFVQQAFARLVESRHEQVMEGLPMCALPINARPDDVCVRAIALQAERIDLLPGQFWQPLPDNDPCGPHFGIMVKGKALIETIEEQRMVTALVPGALFPEGLAAEYNTRARAVTHCEGYRVRQNDFLVAVYSMPSAQEWFYRFRLLDKQTRAHLNLRLSAVKGVREGVVQRPEDHAIQEWKTRRQRAIENARRKKVERPDDKSKLPAMAHVSSHAMLELEADSGSALRPILPAQERCGMTRPASVPDLPRPNRGLEAYPAMRLPRLGTAG